MIRQRLLSFLKIVAIPVGYAIVLRLFFGVNTWHELFDVMSLSFLCCLPFGVGALTVYLSDQAYVQKVSYRIIAPWIPIFAFLLLTIFVSLEGWACWLMILPLFMLAASVGGLVGGYFKLRKSKKNGNVYLSFLVTLPLLVAPLETLMGKIPGNYEAYTYIDIHASAGDIWANVTRVPPISRVQDTGWLTRLLGFPRPLRAELNFEGVGAYREAIFTNGLVFHETVSEYQEKQKMVFSIKAYPHEIPSTTMDEHVVIGGEYFDVLYGTYQLEQLSRDQYRLHLSSHFKLHTTFNFYASWWSRWIMQDIQNNILRVIKERSEKK